PLDDWQFSPGTLDGGRDSIPSVCPEASLAAQSLWQPTLQLPMIAESSLLERSSACRKGIPPGIHRTFTFDMIVGSHRDMAGRRKNSPLLLGGICRLTPFFCDFGPQGGFDSAGNNECSVGQLHGI